MPRAELEHPIRVAADITNDDEIVVIGSQAIQGQFPDAGAQRRANHTHRRSRIARAFANKRNGSAKHAPSRAPQGRQSATRSSASGRLSSTTAKSAGTIERVSAAAPTTRRRTSTESRPNTKRTNHAGSR